MATYKEDHNLLWLSSKFCKYVVNEFNDLDEVSAKLLYTGILEAVKEVISDDKIDYLMNMNQVLMEINKIKSDECLKNYQNSDGIGHFNLVSLACKNKAIKVLEYLFSEESQTLHNLSIQISGHKNESLLSVKDEFCHNAFYYAIRSNMTDLLNILVEKWQCQYSDEDLDDLLSQSYKELKLRNVSLTREMQLFVQSKILDLRFFHESTGGNSGTGNSWDQIKKRIELVVRCAQSIKTDYWDQDPDDKFILIAEFIAKNIHVLKSLLKSTYDRLPWEEIEFCLIIFIRCCKNSSKPNLVYNCALNKKQMLLHLFNFSIVLDTKHDKFENSNVIKLAKSVNLPRDSVVDNIIKENSEFRELYHDFEKIRDFCSLEIIKSYADLIESINATEKRKHLLVSRVLQVMGEHFKNTLESPKLSTSTANALLSSVSSNTRQIITKLRDSLSHEETLIIRSEIDKRAYIFKNIQTDLSRIKAAIPDILYAMKIASVKSLANKLMLCESLEDMKECYGPYRYSIDLYSKEMENIDLQTSVKRDFERLEEMLLCLDKNLNYKSNFEKILFEQIYNYIREEKERFGNLKQSFQFSSVSCILAHIFKENISCHLLRRMANNTEDDFLLEEEHSDKMKSVVKMVSELFSKVASRVFPSENEEVKFILFKIMIFLNFEMGSVKWIEEFGDIMCRNANKKLSLNLSENLLRTKLSQLKETLLDFDLTKGTSSTYFSSFESNMELQAATEILVLDILGILESSCSRNPFFLDSDLPVIIGKNLRNYLAHGNAIIDACLESSAAQLFVNANNILNQVLLKNSKKMDRVIKCDCLELENSIDSDLRTISNQRKLFVALGEGNMTGVEECVNEGADVYGKDCNSSTCLHFAGKAPDIAALKWILKQQVNIYSKDTAGQTVLHIAANFNRLEVMWYLVEQEHMSLVVSDVNGKTPLHIAVENQSNEIVKYLSKFEICLARKDIYGLTPLHTAILWNNIDAAKILLDKETDVDENRSSGNLTALHLAAKCENLYLVKLLIEKKASLDLECDFGVTALQFATLKGNFEIVKTLVESGADVNAKNECGIPPLLNAVGTGKVEIVEFLLQHGADINAFAYQQINALMVAAEYGHASVARLLLQKGAFVNSKGYLGLTPLHFAAFGGHYEIVELLLNHKAVVDCKSDKKQTPLHFSVFGGHKEIVQLLLEAGADVDATESTNCTPLLVAAAEGHEDIVNLLIHEGADINCKDGNEMTALHMAAINEDRGTVESLLKKGADIRSPNANKNTPLCFLIARGLSDLLTPEGKDVKTSDDNGYTLLHVAALYGDQMLVEYCIENSCEINARSTSGLTALHLAAQGNHEKIISLLLNNDADIHAKDSGGWTPLMFAVACNCRYVVEILVSHETYDLKFISDDKIQALQRSVLFGYCNIVDILLEYYKFDVDSELKRNLFITAVRFNHKNVVSTLLERGFEINGDSKPLHVAVVNGLYHMAEHLLSNGANPNLLDEDNCTPLDIAVKLGDDDMLEILLTEKADIRTESKFILSAAEYAVRENQLNIIKLLLQRKVIDVNFKGSSGSSLLHTSALSGSLDVTKYLVAEGADINVKDKEERKPVHIAAEKGFKDMVEFYLKYSDLGDDETAALFLVAARNGKANVCDLLLEKNVDVNAFRADDESPINLALVEGHKEVLSVLLHHGAYYNAHPSTLLKLNKDNDAGSLLRKVKNLFTAVQNNMASEVETLLKEESNSKYCLANARCVEKETVLHYACLKGYEEIVDILLKYKTNPNTRNETGDTPLHYAVKFSYFRIVKALLSNGAIYNALAESSKSPLDYATDRDIRDLLLFLNTVFTKVQDKDLSVLENVRRKDEGTMRSVIRAKNQEGKTLIEVAHICGFPVPNKLEMLFESDLVHEYESAAKFSHEKRYNEAFLALESILRKTVAVYGADSQAVLDVKRNLAAIFQEQGNLEKALHLRLEVYVSRKTSLGEDHVKTLLDETGLAVLLLKRGETHEPLRILEAVYTKLKGKLKPDDLNMIKFEKTFISALFEMNKFDEILKINNEAEKMCAQKEGKKYRILLADFQFLTAIVYSIQGKHSEALRLFEQVHKTRKNILTPHHSSTLEALSAVAKELYSQKRYEDSLEVYREVLGIQKLHLPVDHIDILESEYQVGKILYSQGMLVETLKIFLSLEPKIALVAPDSDLMKETKETIAALKFSLSAFKLNFMLDVIQNKIREADGNHEY
ncbi:Ankyrin-3 [Araneus ventricosus]|uniref:Alpha-latrotoxin n=1 Tax=Araneus ventricosus TaxID=182803 RepID=A0A4Y2EMN2_ARAVE|nr:Ankyrin-3 [Araneus ventricosus]